MSDMSLLGRLFGSRSKDPYWERFIYTAPVDPNNSLTPAIQAAPEGNTFPVKTEVEDPAIMSRDLKELATTMGASMAGVAALTPELLEAGEGAPGGDDAGDALRCRVRVSRGVRPTEGPGSRRTVAGAGSGNPELLAAGVHSRARLLFDHRRGECDGSSGCGRPGKAGQRRASGHKEVRGARVGWGGRPDGPAAGPGRPAAVVEGRTERYGVQRASR